MTFDGKFFDGLYPQLLERFARDEGIEPQQVVQRVRLRDGSAYEVDGGTWALDWIEFHVSEGDVKRVFVAFADIVAIELEAGSGGRYVGFTAAPAES